MFCFDETRILIFLFASSATNFCVSVATPLECWIKLRTTLSAAKINLASPWPRAIDLPDFTSDPSFTKILKKRLQKPETFTKFVRLTFLQCAKIFSSFLRHHAKK